MKNTSPKLIVLSPSRRAMALACSFIIVLAMVTAFVTVRSRASLMSLFALSEQPPTLQGGGTGTLYLHGTGGPVTNPTTLSLNSSAPTSSTAKSKDSASINRNGGNPWKEVGTWTAGPAAVTGTIASLSDLHLWLGLKNSDDQGTYFDLKVEAYKNSSLLTSGQTLCIQGVTRNANNAKEVVVDFGSFAATPFNGTSDVLNLKILTRVGSTPQGTSCGGHNNAVGLRVYFDSTNRPARFTTTQAGAADQTPPVLTVTQPADQALIASNQVDVTGTFSDQSPTTVTVNGVAARLDGGNFLAQVPLTEGPNSLLIVATDSAGNHTDVTRTVFSDTSPPTLSVQQPADFTYTSAASIQVTGTFSGATSITVNGAPPTINGNQFSADVQLTIEGVNTITVLATDAAGNQSDLFLTVHRDTISPVISLTSPQDGSFARTLLTQGSVTDASPLTVTVDGVQVTLEDEFFQAQNEVTDGPRQVTVTATDAAGNHSSVIRSVTIDTTSPLFTNISPADGSSSGSPATITGHVSDSAPVTVRVNDISAIVNANGDFTATNVPLVEGANALVLTAVDAAGNENSENVNLLGPDGTAPAAPVIFPVNSPTRLITSVIGGRAEPGSSIVITGGTAPVTAQADFVSGLFATTVNLAVGTNNLSITAADVSGNAGPAAQVSVVSDPTLEAPPSGQAAQINISTGNGQKGLVNAALPRLLIAIVTDQAGTPVADTPVTFTLHEGGGRFAANNSSAVVVNTDAHGYARASYISGPNVGLQLIRADFAGNRLTPATFLAEALRSTGTQTTVSGVVLDQNLRALPNVLVRIGGQQARTRADGRFNVTNVTSGPHQLLEFIGRDQITLPGRWPNISYDLDVLPGVDNRLGRPFFLPRVNAGVNLPLDANNVVTQDTTYELPVVGNEPPVRVTAKAGTRVIFPPDVTDKRLSITRIPNNRIPMALEDGRATNLYISVQPSGAVFETPLEVSFPNLDRLPPNTPVLLMSFDHDAGRYVQVGTGHVSSDGRSVTSDPGSGIRVGAWHGAPPSPPQPEATILGFIQVAGNPAFENKEIVQIDAWAEGQPATVTPNPIVAPISNDVPMVSLMATLSLASGSAVSTRIESVVVAEKKLKIKFDSFDKRFAPSVERLNFKYTITAGDGDPPAAAKFEVFKSGDTSNPIYVDTALAPVADKLDYSQGGATGWEGKINQGADNGKYIEPKNGPFTLRITVATKPDFSDAVKDEKIANIEIDEMELTPSGEFKSFKPSLNATEVDNPIELTMKIKNKAGQGVVTSIPFKIKWIFDDPDDTAGNNIIDPLGGGGDDNVEVQFGGKRANTGNPASAAVMWKTVSGFTAVVAGDGQSVDAELSVSGADQGKSKLTFSTSVMNGDNYHLIAQYLKDDSTVFKEKRSGRWSVWKRFEFGHVYRMNGGVDIGNAASRANVNPAYNGDGYTDYNLARVVNLASGPQSPEFIVNVLPPLPAELPATGDTQAAINAKAQAWFDRNEQQLGQALTNLVATIGAPAFSIIGARRYHPKLDGNTGTGSTNHYPSATRINAAHQPNPPLMVDPDGEWRNVGATTTGNEIAFVFLGSDAARLAVTARHETGHASDHVEFGLNDGGNGDHASSGLMHPSSDQGPANPNGNPNFSPRSIRRLRSLRN
jgi:Glucodextranase, domain B